MNRILNILLCEFIFLASLNSQFGFTNNQKIIFQGIIRDASTLSPLANSQIFLNGTFYAATDSTGNFSFSVSRYDTVEFSLLGYKTARIVVNDTLTAKDYMAGIFLNSDTISIGEVIIVPRLANLRSEILNSPRAVSPEVENAKTNLALSAYQAKVNQGKIGDPLSNYEVLRQKQRTEAYEKGQIPSSRIAGLSPFMIIPAIYLMMNGLPQKPPPMKHNLTEDEINQIQKKYLESLRKNQ